MDVDIALRAADCDRGNGPKSVALDVLAAEVRRLHAVIDDWEGVEGTSGFIHALRATEGDA